MYLHRQWLHRYFDSNRVRISDIYISCGCPESNFPINSEVKFGPSSLQRWDLHGQVGSELAKVNGLTAKAEVSLHELSSSTDIEKVGFWGVVVGWRLGLKGMKGVLVEDMVFWVICWRNFDRCLGPVLIVGFQQMCFFWNRRSEAKASLVGKLHILTCTMSISYQPISEFGLDAWIHRQSASLLIGQTLVWHRKWYMICRSYELYGALQYIHRWISIYRLIQIRMIRIRIEIQM